MAVLGRSRDARLIASLAALIGILCLVFGVERADAVYPGQNAGLVWMKPSDGGGNWDARVAGPSGEDDRVAISGVGYEATPFPDGNSIAVQEALSSGSKARYLADLDGNRIAELGEDEVLDFSRDGSQTLVVRYFPAPVGLRSRIGIRDLETGQVSFLTPEGLWIRYATFTPDERKIVYGAVETRTYEGVDRSVGVIYIMNSDGSGVVELAERASAPSVSPNGSKIAFDRPISWPAIPAYGHEDIWVMDIDGTNPENLTSNPELGTGHSSKNPQFSPDGTKIVRDEWAIESGQHKPSESGLVVSDITGAGSRLVLPYGTGAFRYEARPRWMPVPTDLDLEVGLDGFESGPDEVTLFSLLRNNAEEGAITDLTYPGGPGAGLIANTAPYEPERRGAVSIFRGPSPTLPGRLGVGEESSHSWTLAITKPGVVMVRAEAEGKGPTDSDVSDTDFVEIEATRYTPDQVEQQAIFAGAYMDAMDQLRDDADAAILQAVSKMEKKLRQLGKFKKDLKRSTPQEDLVAEAFGLPAGAFDFLPDKAKNVLLFAKARQNAKQKGWKKSLVGGAEKFAVEPVKFWGNQFFGSDPSSKFQVGQELYEIAGETKDGLQSFAGDAYSLLSLESAEQIADGLPIVIDEHVAGASRAISEAGRLGKQQVKEIYRAFKQNDRKGIKKAANAIGGIESKIEVAVVTEIVIAKGAGLVGGLRRLQKATKAVEAVDDLPLPRRDLRDLLPRTIDDGLAAPSAAELGMSATDQKLIGDVLAQLEQKAANLGYPGLDLEAAFRSRGYSAPGAIGKNQYMKGKTGGPIDLILGMNKAGLGNNAIFRPSLPKNLEKLPREIKDLIVMRFQDQQKNFIQWNRAKKGKKSKLEQLFKATKKKTTFENKVDGVVTNTTEMKLGLKKKGNTEILTYEELISDGTKIVGKSKKGKGTAIGSDYDGLYLGLKGGADIPAGVRGALWLEANQLFTKLARDKGFAWGFHGLSRNGFEFGAGAYHGKIWEYVAESLPTADALRLFGDKGDGILSRMTFGQYAVKVTKDGATTGPITP